MMDIILYRTDRIYNLITYNLSNMRSNCHSWIMIEKLKLEAHFSDISQFQRHIQNNLTKFLLSEVWKHSIEVACIQLNAPFNDEVISTIISEKLPKDHEKENKTILNMLNKTRWKRIDIYYSNLKSLQYIFHHRIFS